MVDTPQLSIVVTGRNDNYGGDSRSRFLRTLRFNLGVLRERSVTTEVVLVEWNPIAGRPTLFDVTREQITSADAECLVGYIVAPQYQRALTQNPALGYLEYAAKNVGIRRARGRFVLVTNIDIYLSRGAADWLGRADAIVAAVLHRAARVDVILSGDQTRVTWELLEQEAIVERRPRLRGPLYAGGAGDFVLLDRDNWHLVAGFNEVCRVSRAGIDHNLLVKAFGCGLEIRDIGHPVYHVNHPGSYRIAKTALDSRESAVSWGQHRWPYRHVAYDNPPNWGLRDAPHRRLSNGATYLDFAWTAVPPITDFRRVVLPLRKAYRQQIGS